MSAGNVFAVGASKLLVFRNHLDEWKRTGSSVPITLEVHPTERCNQRCPDCQSLLVLRPAEARRRARVGEDLDLSLLDSIWEFPPEGVVLSGNTGDPFLHPMIGPLIEILASRKVPVAIVTNGLALSPELSRLVISSCRGVRISLDADGPELYRRTHGGNADTFEHVVGNVRALMRARQDLGLGPENCLVGIGFLTGPGTRDQMVGGARLAASLGVDYIHFRPYHFDQTDVSKEIEQSQSQESHRFRVFGSTQKYRVSSAEARTYGQCHGASFFTVIDARADLYLCCHHVGNIRARLGSLMREDWASWVRSVRRRVAIEQFDIASCLPRCRLDSHNRVLEHLRSGTQICATPLDDQALRHAPFL